MKTIKGPAIFLAQFVGDEKPFNNLTNICKWAKDLGYKAVQIPTWDHRLIDITKAGESKDYCDEIKGIVHSTGLEISELSTHLQGQLVASHYAYDKMFDAFAPKELHGNVKERTKHSIEALENVGLKDRTHHKPNQLSGGQQQRVSIARAIAGNPKLILADEPTGALDSKTSLEIMKILNDLNSNGITIILVTHEKDIAQYGSRIIKMKDGKIIEDKKNVSN